MLSSKQSSVFLQIVFLLCALLPFVWLLIVVQLYGIDVWHYERLGGMTFVKALFVDGDITPLIHRFQTGLHRAPLGILIGLLRLKLTNGDMWYTLIASPILAFISTIFLWRISQFSLRKHSTLEQKILVFVLIVFTFSLTQWEGWTRAFTGFYYVTVLFLLAHYFLGKERKNHRVVAAALFCFLATFLYSNGIVSWVALIPFFISRKDNEWRVHYETLMPWITAFLGTAFLFFIGRTPDFYAQTAESTQSLWNAVKFVLIVLGSPLNVYNPNIEGNVDLNVIAGTGLVILIVFMATVIRMVWKDREKYHLVCPWICVFLFSLGSAITVALGRANLGYGQAFSSRYITIGYLAFIGLMYMVQLSLRNQRLRYSMLYVWVLLAGINICQGLRHLPYMEEDKVFFDQGKACLEVYPVASEACLGHLHSDGEFVREQAPKLERLGYLVPFTLPDGVRFVETQGENGAFSIQDGVAAGWATLENCRPPHRVLLTYGDTREALALTVTGLDTEDAMTRCNHAGWKVTLNTAVLNEQVQNQIIEAWAYDEKNHRLLQLSE